METNEIKESMLSGEITITKNTIHFYHRDLKGNYLAAYSRPKDCRFSVNLHNDKGNEIDLTDEQYNMVCKYLESEFNEYHSNNTAFTDDDKEHFNSLI